MECLKPIRLKNGNLVPCGHCTLCQSKIRTEKSVLVQIHCDSFQRMPLFIGLSYDPEHLPRYCCCPTEKRLDHAPAFSHERFYRKASVEELKLSCTVPSLYRHDISTFIKTYKKVHGLRNSQFTYFGCGEYGDSYDRPHYHLIWFGDTNLERIYDYSVHAAEKWLAEFWQNGHVDINVAEWSGIHYVTKYCLKDGQTFPEGAVPPFTISSNGIGLNWLKSLEAEKIRQKLLYLHFNKDEIYSKIDLFQLSWDDDPGARIDLLKQWLDYFQPIVPSFTVMLPSGNKAFLPRKLKDKLLGNFQHFSESPVWLYNFISEMYETEVYIRDHWFYDKDAEEMGLAMQARKAHAEQIQRRINRNKCKK